MKLSRKAVSLILCICMMLALAAPVMAAEISGYGTVTTTSLNVYSTASKASILGTFAKDDVVAVEAVSGDMYKVRLSGSTTNTGYVEKSAIASLRAVVPSGKSVATMKAAEGSSSSSTTGVIANCNDSVNFRATASTSGSSLGKLKLGTALTILGQESGFYKVTANGKTGYVATQYVKITSGSSSSSSSSSSSGSSTASSTRTGTINSSATLYKTASTATRIKTLSKDTTVTILGESGSYYNVRAGSDTGYVEKSKVTIAASSAVSSVVGNIKVMPGSSSPASAISTGLANAKAKNSDTIGYIKLAGTKIDQPILHSDKDPFYYLTYDISKKKSSAACVNSLYGVLVRNNTITAHNMRVSGTMLHELHHLQEKALGKSKCDYSKCKSSSLSSYPNMASDSSARIWDVSMFGYNKWEVWAMYEVKQNEPKSTLTTNMNTLNSYSVAQRQSWINNQLSRSQVKFNTEITTDDIILTVYTCGDNYDSSTAQSRLFFFLKAVA